MSREPIRPLVTHFNIYRCLSISHGGLVAVSAGYPPGTGMLLTRYAPLRRSPPTGIATRRDAPRLACVKPAASVHPEPGSNSSLYISISLCLSGFSELTLLLCFACLYFQSFQTTFILFLPGTCRVCLQPLVSSLPEGNCGTSRLDFLASAPGYSRMPDRHLNFSRALPVPNSNNLSPRAPQYLSETPFSFGDCKGTLFLFPSKLFLIFFRKFFIQITHNSE